LISKKSPHVKFFSIGKTKMTLLRKFNRFAISFAFLIGLVFNAHAQTTVVVSGDIKSVFSTTPPADARVKICFGLKDAAGQPIANPRVSGVGIIAQDNVCVSPTSGHFSATLYGNDVVSVNGQTGVTMYFVSYLLNNVYAHGDNYILNGHNIHLWWCGRSVGHNLDTSAD
jgi:hypothetical protein